MTRLGTRSGRARALWFTVFWVAVGVASFVLGVQSAIGQLAEENVLDAAEFTTNPPAPLNLVSEASLLLTLIVICCITWAAHGWRRAVGVGAVSAAALVASQLLKLQVLTRPALLELETQNTFPSGHMTAFTVVVAAAIWAVPSSLRAFVALGGAVLLSVVSWQLLAYGWHRPSDVFGAIALGAAAFALAALIRTPRSARSATLGRTVSIGLIMSAWALVAGALILLAVAASNQNTSLLLTAGQFGAFGASALASRSVLLLAEPR